MVTVLGIRMHVNINEHDTKVNNYAILYRNKGLFVVTVYKLNSEIRF